jgi:hypothetical protein
MSARAMASAMRLHVMTQHLVPPETVDVQLSQALDEPIPFEDLPATLAPSMAPPLGRRPEFTPPTQLLAARQLLAILREGRASSRT